MLYFWILDQAKKYHFNVEYIGDYTTKPNKTENDRRVRCYYTHKKNSPRYITIVLPPIVL